MSKRKRRRVPGVTVYRRGGRFAYLVETEPDVVTGDRRREYKGGYLTYDEAWDGAIRTKAAIEENRYVPPARRTMREFFTEWLEVHRDSFKPTTYQNYVDYLDAYILPMLGKRQLRDITVQVLNAFYRRLLESGRRKPDNNTSMYEYWFEHTTSDHEPTGREIAAACGTTIDAAREAARRYRRGRVPTRKSKGLAMKTVRNVHGVLHLAFKDAVAWHYLPSNPAEYAALPRAPKNGRKARPTPWTVEQLTAWLTVALQDRYAALWMLVATSGMRRGELAGAHRDLLDLEKRQLRIEPTRPVVRGRAHDSDETKTAAGGRTIALDEFTAQLLARHLAMLDAEREEFGENYQDSGRLFCYPDGHAPHPQTITDMFNRLVDRAGAPRIRLHDVRHTYATLSLDAGINIKIVSDRLGHANTTVTSQIYGHRSTGQDREAAEEISKLIRPDLRRTDDYADSPEKGQ